MMSYAAEGGGVGPHFDHYDVFLVQMQGQRHWQVGGQYDDTSAQKENLPVMILEEFRATENYQCEPGDILYIPPGYGHNGVATSNDCMTCSIGFRAPSHEEILREYTDYISDQLNEALRYQDADLIAQENTGEISQQAINKLHAILREHIDNKKQM